VTIFRSQDTSMAESSQAQNFLTTPRRHWE